VQLGANFTIGSAVTVNDIKIALNGNKLTIEGNASKLKIKLGTSGKLIIKGNASELIVEDSNSSNIEEVTVDAGATVTGSTIILNRGGVSSNRSDQLIVEGILKNSTVVVNASAAEAAIIKLAGTLDSVTFSCKISADTGNGVCIEATAAGAQIINNSRVDFEASSSSNHGSITPSVVKADNGVTIIGSTIRRIGSTLVKAIAVNHGSGALVVQNSTIDLGAIDNSASCQTSAGVTTCDDTSRAVSSNATSGSIILTGNIFGGYNRNDKPVVEITGSLGRTPQQIANNQFRITERDAIGILLPTNAPDTLIDQYANRSGNTFGASTTKVKRL
jgi:hypothetical protein